MKGKSTIKVKGFTGKAIQRAINKVAKHGGGVVILPPGIYKINKRR